MSEQLHETDALRALLLDETPLLDVRAPSEFSEGAAPHAHNAPLMSDRERHRVGLCYSESGQEAAIQLGHQLVSGETRAERIEQWIGFAQRHPEACLYCSRGGLRSRIAQQWLQEAGVTMPRIAGGYKAVRRLLLDDLEARCPGLSLLVVSGRTGTGKTRLLHQLPNPVDLEGLAAHRGSSFGRMLAPQPAQADFENALAIALMKADQPAGRPIHVEDESHMIGKRVLPKTLQERMATAPLMVLEQPLETRIDCILQDYVIDMSRAYMNRDGPEAGFAVFREFLLGSLSRIRKRLGGLRYQQLEKIMAGALDAQQRDGDLDGHREWIRTLLNDYYDPMYDHHLSRRDRMVAIRGSFEELLEWSRRSAVSDTST
mgnify:CR=1 FL=1